MLNSRDVPFLFFLLTLWIAIDKPRDGAVGFCQAVDGARRFDADRNGRVAKAL